LRKKENALLTYGSLEWHLLDDQNDCISFSRVFNGRQLIFYFNQGNRAGEIRLQDFNMERSRKVYRSSKTNGEVFCCSQILT
ncbi:hypothetical protein ACQKF6_17880, partial [Bacillus velezensis]